MIEAEMAFTTHAESLEVQEQYVACGPIRIRKLYFRIEIIR